MAGLPPQSAGVRSSLWLCLGKSLWLQVLLLLLLLLSPSESSPLRPLPFLGVCERAFCRVINEVNNEVAPLRSRVEKGLCVEKFGQTADRICTSALERFSNEAQLTPDDEDVVGDDQQHRVREREEVFAEKLDQLEQALDAPLRLIFLQNLRVLRKQALELYETLTEKGEMSDGEAIVAADSFFRTGAEESKRRAMSNWGYKEEVDALRKSMHLLSRKREELQAEKIRAASQNSQALQYMQAQQQQLEAIQQQSMQQGASQPWNAALAYRLPNSNINLACTYQQGRGNVQITCVPDESVALLGPNGFVNGVTPGNVGLSFNINI